MLKNIEVETAFCFCSVLLTCWTRVLLPCVSGKLLICRWSWGWNSVISEGPGSFSILMEVQGAKLNTKGFPCTSVLDR